MKKYFALVLALVLFLTATGCVEMDASPKKETADGSSQSGREDGGAQALTFGLNEAAVFESLKFTATEWEESKGTEFFEPESGNVFVGVKFAVENISDEEQSLSSLLLFEAYADDVKVDYSFTASCVFDEGSLDGDLAPGKKMVGWYALEVPKTWGVIELEVKADWLSNSTATFVFEK